MNNRIRELRKTTLKMTQKEFSAKLGLSENFIWQIEKGEREPSDRTISDICREFRVNETWLRTGEGEMLQPVNRDAEIAAFMGDVMRGENEDFRRRLVAALSKLSIEEWELLEKVALKLADENKKSD